MILSVVMSIDDSLPTDLASAHALIMAQREALVAAQARATAAESEAQYRALLIEKLKYTIRKLRHERYGQSSERGALLEQLELQLADLEEDASQAEAAARMAAAAATSEKRRSHLASCGNCHSRTWYLRARAPAPVPHTGPQA